MQPRHVLKLNKDSITDYVTESFTAIYIKDMKGYLYFKSIFCHKVVLDV